MSESSSPRVGDRVRDRYELKAPLRAGGPAQSFVAFDHHAGREVELVLFDPACAHPHAWAAFARLVSAAAAAKIPGLVLPRGVTSALPSPPSCLADLQVTRGLDRTRDQGPTPWQRAVTLCDRVAEILEKVYATTGIAHRALTPSRCVVTLREDIKVLDYGVAEFSAGRPDDSPYRAPELARGPGDARSDVYSLAVILFELISGQKAESPLPRLRSLLDVPEELDDWLARCVAPDPANRPPGLPAMRAAMRALLDPSASRSALNVSSASMSSVRVLASIEEGPRIPGGATASGSFPTAGRERPPASASASFPAAGRERPPASASASFPAVGRERPPASASASFPTAGRERASASASFPTVGRERASASASFPVVGRERPPSSPRREPPSAPPPMPPPADRTEVLAAPPPPPPAPSRSDKTEIVPMHALRAQAARTGSFSPAPPEGTVVAPAPEAPSTRKPAPPRDDVTVIAPAHESPANTRQPARSDGTVVLPSPDDPANVRTPAPSRGDATVVLPSPDDPANVRTPARSRDDATVVLPSPGDPAIADATVVGDPYGGPPTEKMAPLDLADATVITDPLGGPPTEKMPPLRLPDDGAAFQVPLASPLERSAGGFLPRPSRLAQRDVNLPRPVRVHSETVAGELRTDGAPRPSEETLFLPNPLDEGKAAAPRGLSLRTKLIIANVTLALLLVGLLMVAT